MATPVEVDARLEVVVVTVGPFPVIVGIGWGHLGIRTEAMDIGGWALADLEISLNDESVTVEVEGERLLLSFDRPVGLSALLREIGSTPV